MPTTLLPSEQYFFLLGGQDLEMVEIAKLLELHEVMFLDAGFAWDGATWSAYMDNEHYATQIEAALSAGKKILGVELFGDILTSKEYITIDHHNDLGAIKVAV